MVREKREQRIKMVALQNTLQKTAKAPINYIERNLTTPIVTTACTYGSESIKVSVMLVSTRKLYSFLAHISGLFFSLVQALTSCYEPRA